MKKINYTRTERQQDLIKLFRTGNEVNVMDNRYEVLPKLKPEDLEDIIVINFRTGNDLQDFLVANPDVDFTINKVHKPLHYKFTVTLYTTVDLLINTDIDAKDRYLELL